MPLLEPRRIGAFACIGVIGFIIDAGLLTYLVIYLGWNPYGARLVSFGTAVTATWLMNRKWTFSDRLALQRSREYSGYISVQLIGAFINFGIYSVIIATVPALGAYPVIPLAIGTSISMVFTFISMRRFVFTGNSKHDPSV